MKVTVRVAKTMLSKLIARARNGEEIVITSGGAPVARLVSMEAVRSPRRRPGTLRGLVKIDDAFFEPLPEELLSMLGLAGTRGGNDWRVTA
jgi:prevent-host-death family protein